MNFSSFSQVFFGIFPKNASIRKILPATVAFFSQLWYNEANIM